jgi:hypothetical protein
VLGAGIGFSMQTLTLIVQNTSRYEDLGVATSGVTFLRTLGSSFGAAVFGSLFANFLANPLADALRASPAVNPAAVHTPKALHALGAEQIGPVVHAYAQALDKVFLWATPVALVGFVLALTLKEVPLRGSSRASAPDLGDGFGMATDQNAEERLQRAIAAIIRTRARDQLKQLLDASGTTLGTAGRWGVLQVARYQAVIGHAEIDRIANYHRLPAAVLEPTFGQLAAVGMITRANGTLTLTAEGQAEAEGLAATLRAWLTEQLADWDQEPDEQQLTEALRRIARRILTDESDQPSTAARPAVAAGDTS